MSDDNPPAVGRRLRHENFRGTIRYVGEIDGQKGVWYGVDWDDESRGKHDGSINGKRYFQAKCGFI